MVERLHAPKVGITAPEGRLEALLWPETAYTGRLGQPSTVVQNPLETSADPTILRAPAQRLPVVRPLGQRSSWSPLQEAIRSNKVLPQRGLAIGSAPELELVTLPTQALEALLRESGSTVGVAALLARGVQSGALQVMGERLLLTRPSPLGEAPARGFDISALVRDALDHFRQEEGLTELPSTLPGALRSLLQRWQSPHQATGQDRSAQEERTVILPGSTQALARTSSGTMPLRGSLPEPSADASRTSAGKPGPQRLRVTPEDAAKTDSDNTSDTALGNVSGTPPIPGSAGKTPLGEPMPLLQMPGARARRTQSLDPDKFRFRRNALRRSAPSGDTPSGGTPSAGTPSGDSPSGDSPDAARARTPLAARGRAGAVGAQNAPRPKPTIHTDRELGRPRSGAMGTSSGTGAPSRPPRPSPPESVQAGRPMMVESTLSELVRQVQLARRQEQEDAHDRTF